MNFNPDYNREMLKLYFKEQGYTREEIKRLLNTNPFDIKFVRWERNTLYSNRLIANTISRKNLIDDDIIIQEITNHEDNSISKYLNNPNEIFTNSSFFKRENGIILVHDNIHTKITNTIINLNRNGLNFITGTCTKDINSYEKKLHKYKKLAREIQYAKVIEAMENDVNICILKKCR